MNNKQTKKDNSIDMEIFKILALHMPIDQFYARDSGAIKRKFKKLIEKEQKIAYLGGLEDGINMTMHQFKIAKNYHSS